MTHDETLAALHADIARQDSELELARQQLEGIGDQRVEVPEDFLRALEDACAPAATTPAAIVIGIRA